MKLSIPLSTSFALLLASCSGGQENNPVSTTTRNEPTTATREYGYSPSDYDHSPSLFNYHEEQPVRPILTKAMMDSVVRKLAHGGKVYGYYRVGGERARIFSAIYHRKTKVGDEWVDRYFVGWFDVEESRVNVERRVWPVGRGGKEWDDRDGTSYLVTEYGWIQEFGVETYGEKRVESDLLENKLIPKGSETMDDYDDYNEDDEADDDDPYEDD
ncbi:MAG: hypothetical protein LUC85_03690 [Bacteroidales bacterium]|nr:hypothetical protein [Bacteroidales bacterium]MCD8393922.1 hypothetical protein [Bacteroidales bacterium]